jgi:hypothetical protein
LPLDGVVKVRFPRESASPVIYETVRGSWICHDDRHVDVCVRPLDLRKVDPNDELSFNSLVATGENNILAVERIAPGLGDEIFIPSLFTGHVGERRNIPVVRHGHIAAMPHEAIRYGSPTRPAFLIETHSLGGTSGAPVFMPLTPSSFYNRPEKPAVDPATGRKSVPYKLIGMILGSHSGRYASDFVVPDDPETVVSKDADFNAGISVALPIHLVMEVLESEPMKNARAATLEAIRKQAGYRPSSARRVTSEPPTTESEGDGSHKERFTALLNAAARKHPQGD